MANGTETVLGSVLERIDAQAQADAAARARVDSAVSDGAEPRPSGRLGFEDPDVVAETSRVMVGLQEGGRPGCKPVIGIVPTQLPEEKALQIPERYASAIIAAGGAPLFLPMTEDVGVYESILPLMDGFVLPGGQDIDPVRYGASRRSNKLSEHTPAREELEYLVLRYATEFDIPVLGICRGMQMINVFFGGSLYLDLEDEFSAPGCAGLGRPIRHWQKIDYVLPSHSVTVVSNSKLGQILGVTSLQVNSMHHQGIHAVAPGLDAVAFGPDGLVEAVEVPDRPFFMGVQWHPEFLTSYTAMQKLFDQLVLEAGAHKCAERIASLHIDRCLERGNAAWPAISFADCI